jgi:hypothetical protein
MVCIDHLSIVRRQYAPSAKPLKLRASEVLGMVVSVLFGSIARHAPSRRSSQRRDRSWRAAEARCGAQPMRNWVAPYLRESNPDLLEEIRWNANARRCQQPPTTSQPASQPASQQASQPASQPASPPTTRKGSPRARILSNWVAKKKRISSAPVRFSSEASLALGLEPVRCQLSVLAVEQHTPDDVKHTPDDVKHTPDDVQHTPDDVRSICFYNTLGASMENIPQTT